MYKCDWCSKEFNNRRNAHKTNFKFCCRRCKENAQSVDGGDRFLSLRPKHYKDGGFFYRKRAFKIYGKICCSCGYYDNDLALDVDHIDGDRSNNILENLQVLCANCHAIKTRGGLVIIGKTSLLQREVDGS